MERFPLPQFLTFSLVILKGTALKNILQDGSPGLVVIGGDSCSEICGFKSQHCILGGHISQIFAEKMLSIKDENKPKRGRIWPNKKHFT